MKITEKTVLWVVLIIVCYFLYLHGLVLLLLGRLEFTPNTFGYPDFNLFLILATVFVSLGWVLTEMASGHIQFEFHIGGKSKKRDEIMKKMHKAKDKEELDLLLIELEKLR